MAGKGRVRSMACAACKKKKASAVRAAVSFQYELKLISLQKGCPHNKPAASIVPIAAAPPVPAFAASMGQIHPLPSRSPTRQDEPNTALPTLRARPPVTPAKRNALSLMVRLPISVQFSDGRPENLEGRPPRSAPFFPSHPHQSLPWQIEVDVPKQAVGKGRASYITPTHIQHGQQLQQKPLQHISTSPQPFDDTTQHQAPAEASTNRGDVIFMSHQTPTSDSSFRRNNEAEATSPIMRPMPPPATGPPSAAISPLPGSSILSSQDMTMTDASAFTFAPRQPQTHHRRRPMPKPPVTAPRESTPASTPMVLGAQMMVPAANHVYHPLPKFAQSVPPLSEPPSAMDINFDTWLEARRDSIIQLADVFQKQQHDTPRESTPPAAESECTSGNIEDFSSTWLPQLNRYINNWSSTANPSEVLKGYNLLKAFGDGAKLSVVKARDFHAVDPSDDSLDYKVHRQMNLAAAAARAHELNRRSVQMWKQVREGRRAVEGQTVAHLGVRRLQEVDLLLKMDREARQQLQEVKRGHA